MTTVNLFIVKFFIKSVFQILYPFTPECFSTKLRGLGSGIAQMIGRLGAAVMPFIIYPLFHEHPHSPFLIFAICSFLGFVTTILMPYDTYSRPLDQPEQENAPQRLPL